MDATEAAPACIEPTEEGEKLKERKKFKFRIPSCCMHVCDAEEDDIGDKLCCKHDCGDLPWTTVEIDKNGKRIYRDDCRNRNNPDGVT